MKTVSKSHLEKQTPIWWCLVLGNFTRTQNKTLETAQTKKDQKIEKRRENEKVFGHHLLKTNLAPA